MLLLYSAVLILVIAKVFGACVQKNFGTMDNDWETLVCTT